VLPVSIYIGVTGQYHKTYGKSITLITAAGADRSKEDIMKCKALFGLRLLLGLILFALVGGPSGGLDVVVQHIQTVGARQWLSLVAGSVVSNTPGAVAPVSRRIARVLHSRSVPLAGEETAGGNIV
jgi:hypothetical protein